MVTNTRGHPYIEFMSLQWRLKSRCSGVSLYQLPSPLPLFWCFLWLPSLLYNFILVVNVPLVPCPYSGPEGHFFKQPFQLMQLWSCTQQLSINIYDCKNEGLNSPIWVIPQLHQELICSHCTTFWWMNLTVFFYSNVLFIVTQSDGGTIAHCSTNNITMKVVCTFILTCFYISA